jgi:hypothetical protein
VAEEVGAAFVSLVPSARGFSTKARAEIRREMAGKDIAIPVTPEVDRAQLTRALTGATAGQRGAVPVATNVDPAQLRRQTRTAVAATQATRPTVHVQAEVDVDRNRLTRAMTGIGTRGGGSLAGAVVSGFAGSFKPTLITGAIAGALFLSSPLVAAASLFGASLAGIVLGAFGLRADRELRIAAGGLIKVLDSVITTAAQPLKGPFLEALGILSSTVIDIAPDLAELFKAVAPYIPELARGVSGFLKAFTPGLVQAVKDSGPVINQIAAALPDLGQALGQFLETMGRVSPQAGKFIGMFLRGIADIIRVTGDFIGFMTEMFGKVSGFFSLIHRVGFETVEGWKIIIRVIRGDTDLLRAMIGAAIDWIKEWWGKLWRQDAPGAIRAGLSLIGAIARKIPSVIISGALSVSLRPAGRNIMNSLIQGITDRIPNLRGVMARAANVARAFWPFSPAKMGPLSGSGSLWYAGRNLVDDLTGGMQSRLPAVQSASSQLAGAVGVGSAGSMAAAGGKVVIGSDGSRLGDLLLSVLQESVRARGGVDVVFAR